MDNPTEGGGLSHLPSTNVKTVVVVGQGYVGLPIAMRAVEVGFRVIGLDKDARRIERLKNRDSYVEDISADRLNTAFGSGRYSATTDAAEAVGFDIAVITVPTPLRESLPDLSYIESAAQDLAPMVRPGCTVILESTTYPGTTEELMVPRLEAGSGLRAGTDFHVGYSPERIDPGNPVWTLETTPKVVAGIDPASLAHVSSFYEALVNEVVPVSSCKTAELTKLLENTFRHVNIALVNELAVFANELDIDIWEAVEAAATKPFGFMKFTPGPGVGGHCLPVDPSYLSWRVRQTLGKQFRFVELANDVNEHMPDYVVWRLIMLLNRTGRALNGAKVLVLGLSYKKNSGDARESPAVRVVELLTNHGADVRASDPFMSEPPRALTGVTMVEVSDAAVADADVVVLLTDHDAFDLKQIASHAAAVLDTRNRFEPSANVERL